MSSPDEIGAAARDAAQAYGDERYAAGAASRQAEVDVLRTQEAADITIIATLRATYATLQAAFDAYKASHPDPEPVDQPVVMGMNFKHNSPQTQEALADAARIYVPPGWMDIKTLDEFNRAYKLGVRVFVLSWKDVSTATIGPMLDSVPDDCTVYGVAHHEPEDDSDMQDGAWQMLQLKHIPVMRAHGVEPWPVLMAWTLDPASGRDINDWTLPAGLVDGYGFDLYPTSVKGQAASVARIKAALPILGVDKYLIGEYGVSATNPALGVQMIDALHGLVADAEVALYWSSRVSTSKPDYRFTEQTATAWYA